MLAAVAERAQWDTRPSPKRGGTGRGVALALRGGTYVATVAEVEVDARSGAVRVKRLVCVHDCGLIVNPGALRGTIQANLIQSLGRTLKEEVKFDQTHVTNVDWRSYPVARWADVPGLENHRSGRLQRRLGMRCSMLRRVPLTPERVKAALG